MGNPIGIRNNTVIMCNNYKAAIRGKRPLPQEIHYVTACFGIKGRSRLIAYKKQGLVNNGSRKGNALFFPCGKLFYRT